MCVCFSIFKVSCFHSLHLFCSLYTEYRLVFMERTPNNTFFFSILILIFRFSDSLYQVFGNLLGDTIVRIENMGRPNPILESPFAKLLKAEEAFHSNPSTPVKPPNNVVSIFILLLLHFLIFSFSRHANCFTRLSRCFVRLITSFQWFLTVLSVFFCFLIVTALPAALKCLEEPQIPRRNRIRGFCQWRRCVFLRGAV